MADVFLSYARPSLKDAKRVAPRLRSAGYSVWFDEKLPAHRVYSDVIEEQLDSARAVVVLWSAEAAKSQWVRSEANRARESGRLVQLRLDDARLPMPFDQIQCADLSHWRGDPGHPGFSMVADSIAALLGGEPAARPTPGGPGPTRRALLAGGGAVALAAAGGFAGWVFLSEGRRSPQGQLLLQKGLDALQTNDALETEDVGSTMQAIAFLRDATTADPRSASAWGALAVAYAVRKKAAPVAERAGLEQRSRSAAKTALALDADEPWSAAGLRLLQPVYRQWLAAERADREAQRRHPRFPLLMFILAEMLGQVGRWKDAAELTERFDRTAFLIAGADRRIILNRWSAGNLESADEAARVAAERWPQHPGIWRTRIAYLLFSGRPAEAIALIDNESERPPDTPPELVTGLRAAGEALAGRRNANDAVSAALAYLETKPSAALQVAQAVTALGRHDTALVLFDGYYFGEGAWARLAPPGGDQDRLTGPLFQPPMRSLWKDPRFDRHLQRIGLTEYWRRSGTLPDYRRTA